MRLVAGSQNPKDSPGTGPDQGVVCVVGFHSFVYLRVFFLPPYFVRDSRISGRDDRSGGVFFRRDFRVYCVSSL